MVFSWLSKAHCLNLCRDDTIAMFNCDEHLLSRSGVTNSHLPQQVLESLVSIPESSEQKPSSMDWKRVAKKMKSFGQGLEFRSANIPKPKQDSGQGKFYLWETVA